MFRLLASSITKKINLFFRKLKEKFINNVKTIDEDINNTEIFNEDDKLSYHLTHEKHEEILFKLKHFMDVKKIYKDPDLTIKDVATMVGTNRSYISSTINYFNKTNFPTFLNKYRCEDFQQQFRESPEETCSNLSNRAGFGSVDSMKRTIFIVTGMPFKDWRAKTLAELEKNNQP
jgi:AraC-like DNA-binding protein